MSRQGPILRDLVGRENLKSSAPIDKSKTGFGYTVLGSVRPCYRRHVGNSLDSLDNSNFIPRDDAGLHICMLRYILTIPRTDTYTLSRKQNRSKRPTVSSPETTIS